MSHQSHSSTLCIISEGKQRPCCSGASPALSAPTPAGDASALWPSAQFFSLEPGDSCASLCQFCAALVPSPSPPASAALQILSSSQALREGSNLKTHPPQSLCHLQGRASRHLLHHSCSFPGEHFLLRKRLSLWQDKGWIKPSPDTGLNPAASQRAGDRKFISSFQSWDQVPELKRDKSWCLC